MTEPARPSPPARALAVLIATTGALGSTITIGLAFTPLPWWLVTAPLWTPIAAAYLAITWAAAITFAGALLRNDRGDRG